MGRWLTGCCIGALTVAGLAAPAAAQIATPAPAAASDVGAVEEIIITARRREESLQSVPVAVAAFSADQLRDRSITTIADLGSAAPNLFVSSGPSGGAATGAFFIRGVGQIDFISTTDPGVAVYLDGVYLARASGNVLDLVTPERVEVLRGPQGTLFGRNTIGGAISVISRRPGDDLALEAEAVLGNRDHYEGKVRVDLPITPGRLATSLVLARQVRDGYGRSAANGEEFGDRDVWAGRGEILFTPSDRFTSRLAADYTRRDERATVHSVSAIDTNDATFPGLQAYNAFIAAPPPPLGFGSPVLASSPTCGPPPAPASACTFALTQASPYDNAGTGPNVSFLRVWGISSNLEIKLDPFTIRLISAYRDQRDVQGIDFDGTPLPVSEQIVHSNSTQVSQEIQFLGSGFGDRLQWLAGLYYTRDESRTLFDAQFLRPAFGPVIQLNTRLDSNSYAAFGSATVTLSERLKVTAGIRYTRDERDIRGSADFLANPFLGGAPSSFFAVGRIPIPGGSIPAFQPLGSTRRVAESWNNFSPKVSLEYQATDTAFFYGSVSRGYKGGSFIGRPLTGSATFTQYDPERVTAYELGAKLDLLDRRLRLNGALFQADYDNIQLTVIVPDGPVVNTPTVNAGTARIRGAELEFVAVPAVGLRLDGSIGYLDADFRQLNAPATFPNAVLPFTTASSFTQTPKWTASAGAQYRLDLGDAGGITLRGDIRHRSSIEYALPNNPLISDPSLTLIGARLTYETEDGRFSVALFGTNLTKEVYKSFGFAGFGLVTSYYGEPRRYGISLRSRI